MMHKMIPQNRLMIHISDLIQQHVDVLIVNPFVDSESSSNSVISAANEAKIIVITAIRSSGFR